jgi:hypothetical protein
MLITQVLDIPSPAGQVDPLIGTVQYRPQGSGAGDVCRGKIPWRHHDARKRVERSDPIILFKKSLPDRSHVRFRDILIAIGVSVYRHQGVQVLLPNGVLRSIEGLIDVIHWTD